MIFQKILCFISSVILVLLFSADSFACLSITDDLNSPNPVINANFSLQPDVSPFTDCWSGIMRIRTDRSSWRLVATRTGPSPSGSVTGNPADNVTASDLTLAVTVQSFGMAAPNGAILVSPFSSQTDLSSIQSGTFIISGVQRSGNSCSSTNTNYYKVTKRLCLFRDFIFNTGIYNGQVIYILTSP
ncbi:MAG: hypothetical protein A3I68_01470 [Candidatus Melainabacteria bacterium RIFCSPLOWO2_02_FULL_35_15]|nr:MAG: hypothetical protein A3I68_01470 [Candidatus Melainabacteria bacterium RIFCSPLOWO2_02_FULL_35_15]